MFIHSGEVPEQKVVAHGPDYPSWKRVLTARGLIPHMMQIATSVTKGPSDSTDGHLHRTMWEIYYILEGCAVFTVGGETSEMGPGDFIAVPPNTLHSHVVADGVELKMFYFGVATDE